MRSHVHALHVGQVAEFQNEARRLADRYPEVYGAVILGRRDVALDQAVVYRPDPQSFPAVWGWESKTLALAIQLDSSTCCLFAGDETGVAPFIKLATSMLQIGFSLTPDFELTEQRLVLGPLYHLVALCQVGKRRKPGMAISVVSREANHPDWVKGSEILVLRQGLFQATLYGLAATMTLLSIEPKPDSEPPNGMNGPVEQNQISEETQQSRSHANDERDAFIFEERTRGITNRVIREQISKNPEWQHLYSDQAVSAALKRFCERTHKPKPQGKPPGRPRKTKQ